METITTPDKKSSSSFQLVDVFEESSVDESQLTLFIPNDIPSVDKIVSNDTFAFELNMGLVLPFAAKPTLYQNEEGGYDPQESFTELPTEDGIILQKAILEQSDKEMYIDGQNKKKYIKGRPLSSFDHLVYMALMDLAYNRMGKCRDLDGRVTNNRLYFQVSEVCRNLGRSTNQESYVKKSIDNLFAQKIAFNTYIQKLENHDLFKATEQKTTKLIVTRGFVSGGYYNENGKLIKGRSIQYIDFEDSIAKGILNDKQHATIAKSVINKLRVNAEVRLMTFIQSKRQYFNNATEFVVKISEVINQINLQRQRNKDIVTCLKKYFNPCSKAAGFTYYIDYPKDQVEKGHIYINFNPTELITFTHDDPHSFYEILLAMYPDLIRNEFFQQNQIDRGFINQVIQDYQNKWKVDRAKLGEDEYCSFRNSPVNPAEFVFDCLLFQINKGFQIKKTFMAVYRAMFDSLVKDEVIYNDHYRYFVRLRFKEEKQKEINERIKRTKKKDEKIRDYRERLVATQFDQYYKYRVENNRRLRDRVKKYFIGEGILEDPGMESLFSVDMRDLCFKMWRETELEPLLNRFDKERTANLIQ